MLGSPGKGFRLLKRLVKVPVRIPCGAGRIRIDESNSRRFRISPISVSSAGLIIALGWDARASTSLTSAAAVRAVVWPHSAGR